MAEPAKPFACSILDCGMSFTNEDHLHVHKKKHDMVLQFGCEQKAAFVADQTPTPTRFIRNCEEVGLFQDLQNVNPFDEGFKRAIENKHGISEGGITTPSSTDDLHTPQMVFPVDPADSVYSTCNQRNITISRSSSEECGAIKELETTTISKLTNQVTTISRIVEKHEEQKRDETKKDSIRTDVSYTNNIIKILSNVKNEKLDTIEQDIVIKERNANFQLQVPQIMSQRSIDKVVDNLTADYSPRKEIQTDRLKKTKEDKEDKKYEVILKLPSGQQIKLTSTDDVKEVREKPNTKDLLKKVLTDKVEMKNLTPVVIPSPIPTLIPVTIVNNGVLPKLPLQVFDKRPVKRKSVQVITGDLITNSKEIMDKESKKAASKRYRDKEKEARRRLASENSHLRRYNERLMQEMTSLKLTIMGHMKKCPYCDDFKSYVSNS